MAVPQRRTSKTAKRMRRSHFHLTVTGLSTCPHCGALIRAHHVCSKCGYYDGKQVVAVPEIDEKKVAAKKAAKKNVSKTETVAPAQSEIKATKKAVAKKVNAKQKIVGE